MVYQAIIFGPIHRFQVLALQRTYNAPSTWRLVIADP